MQSVISHNTFSFFYTHFENWKKLIAKRASYFHRDTDIRDDEQVEYLKAQSAYEKEKLGRLLMESREGLPAAAH